MHDDYLDDDFDGDDELYEKVEKKATKSKPPKIKKSLDGQVISRVGKIIPKKGSPDELELKVSEKEIYTIVENEVSKKLLHYKFQELMIQGKIVMGKKISVMNFI